MNVDDDTLTIFSGSESDDDSDDDGFTVGRKENGLYDALG